MRIAVICGSLAPGSDGVGDYCRCLVSALGEEHQFLLVSIRDKARAEETKGNIEIKRFKGVLLHPEVSERVIQVVHDFQPDVISLQFVPFSFSPKGLVRELIPLVREIVGSTPLHIMFHELWLGEKPSLPFRHKFLGFRQRQLIMRALKLWKPAIIHTSNPHYQDVLSRNGIESKILPLFGNIPIAELDTTSIQSLLTWYPSESTERVILFPFTQSLSWRSKHVLDVLLAAARKADVSLRLIQVGKNTSMEAHWPWIRTFATEQRWSCDALGPRSQAELSQLMLAADVGISSAHVQLAGKSGAVIGMLEHGLPVICTSGYVESRYPVPSSPELERLYRLDQPVEQIAELLRQPTKAVAHSRLPKIAAQLIRDLKESI